MTVAEAQSSVKSGTIKYHTENMTCNDESEVITLHFIFYGKQYTYQFSLSPKYG